MHVTLTQAGLLNPIIQTFIETDKVLDFEAPAEGTAIWHGERACHLIRNDPLAARLEFERSLAIAPSRRFSNQLIQCLIDLREFEAVQAMLDFARTQTNYHYVLFPPRRVKVEQAGLIV